MKTYILALEQFPGVMYVVGTVIFILIIGMLFFGKYLTRKKPAYAKRLPRVIYGEEMIQLLFTCYHTTDSIEGMLQVAVKKSRNKKNKKKLKAALSYLHTSRYKDYETALYVYAGDGREQTNILFSTIIEKEAAKSRLLPYKGGIINAEK